MSNPFHVRTLPNGIECFAVSVEDRLGMIKGFDLEQCADALELPDLQQTVRRALWRRVKALLREEGNRNGRVI